VTPGNISGVAGDSRTRMLNDPLPGRRFVWQLDRTKMEAYQVVSQVAVVRVANVVDPHYTVIAKFPKALLPKR
jgi:hypothetical protein